MAEPHVIWHNMGSMPPRYTLADAVNVKEGDLLYLDGSNNLALADADAASSYAQFISLEARRENDDPNAATVAVATEAIVEDTDAPYTTRQTQYLSSTAGAFTGTRPVSTSTVRIAQVVGFTISTSQAHLRIIAPREVSDYQQVVTKIMATEDEKVVVLDSGNFASFNYNADNDDGYVTVRVPDNAVALVEAYLFYAMEAQVSTGAVAITVGSAIHDAAHDIVTADSSVTALDIDAVAADDIGKLSILGAFDATDIIRPGALLGINFNVDLGGTDTALLFGAEFIWRVV